MLITAKTTLDAPFCISNSQIPTSTQPISMILDISSISPHISIRPYIFHLLNIPRYISLPHIITPATNSRGPWFPARASPPNLLLDQRGNIRRQRIEIQGHSPISLSLQHHHHHQHHQHHHPPIITAHNDILTQDIPAQDIPATVARLARLRRSWPRARWRAADHPRRRRERKNLFLQEIRWSSSNGPIRPRH